MENKDLLYSKQWSFPGDHLLYEVNRHNFFSPGTRDYNLGIIQNNCSVYCERNLKPSRTSLESFNFSKRKGLPQKQCMPLLTCKAPEKNFKQQIETEPSAFTIRYVDDTSSTSLNSSAESLEHSSSNGSDDHLKEYNILNNEECIKSRGLKKRNEKCYFCNQIQNWPTPERNLKTDNADSNKVHVTIIIAKSNTSLENSKPSAKFIKIKKSLKSTERQVLQQDMVGLRCDQDVPSDPSSDEHEHSPSTSTQAGCRCVEYSQVPQLSAFQKYALTKEPATSSRGTAIDKKHNSEQYRRDFSTYDGLTARGRRQAASMPYRRERPKIAAERMQKIRHKLTPVRDYRLMDTVHYLAQGEFAPRDDGIKLTPSREAVLSDIIWEDVCRTHWPNARIGRRTLDRTTTRYELQRLIDSLLRDRVAHVERRRRRHYRIIKLSNRHENCRNVGKTGDIIVASHKHRNSNKYQDCEHTGERAGERADEAMMSKPPVKRDRNSAASAMIPDRRRETTVCDRGHRSCERLSSPEARPRRRRTDEPSPGPSFIVARTEHRNDFPSPVRAQLTKVTTDPSTSKDRLSCCAMRNCSKTPRLVVKKDSRRRYGSKEEADLEHYILLPTLVIKTPSNIRRQKKFSELYHRILEKRDAKCRVGSEAVDKQSFSSIETRDFGVNVNLIKSRNTSSSKQKKSD